MSHHRHSLLCILPPHLLRQIAQNASSAQQRKAALATLSTDQTLRGLRTHVQLDAKRPPVRKVRLEAMDGHKRRTIHDAGSEQTLPGTAVRLEGEPDTGDPAVDEAYEGLGATFDFYWELFARSSIDDEGMPLEATVHFGQDYSNAFWDGQRMVFGDGDGELFQRFTIAKDIIGHELTHGVIDDEAKLVYFQQAGALNESIADVFGALVRQRVLGQTADKADWLVGTGLFTTRVKGRALRSMQQPGSAYDDPVLGKDPQPGHMRDYVKTYEDNGGVHINSGIPNRAFVLAALALGGHAWERAGRIWYEALRDPQLRPTANFRAFAQRTVASAGRVFGERSDPQRAVQEAWNEVGVPIRELPVA